MYTDMQDAVMWAPGKALQWHNFLLPIKALRLCMKSSRTAIAYGHNFYRIIVYLHTSDIVSYGGIWYQHLQMPPVANRLEAPEVAPCLWNSTGPGASWRRVGEFEFVAVNRFVSVTLPLPVFL